MARRTKIVNRECGLETPTGVAMSELLCRAINDTTNADLLAEDVMRLNPDEVRLLYLRIVEGRSLAETGRMVGNKTNNRPADKERTRQRGWRLLLPEEAHCESALKLCAGQDGNPREQIGQRIAEGQRQCFIKSISFAITFQ